MEISLHNLSSPKRKTKKRLGRGESSGLGKSAGRGTKGQKARGKDMPKGFEGGQTPLKWRLPKLKGFKSKRKKKIQVVTLSQIEAKFEEGEIVSPKILKEKGLIEKNIFLVKIIGSKISKKIKVKDCLLSKGARQALKIK